MQKSLLRVLLATTLIAVIFVSCKKDKDDASIEGKWELTSSGAYDFNSGNSILLPDGIDVPSFPQGATFEIKADGTGVARSGENIQDFTWNKQGNNLTLLESKFVIKNLTDSELLLLADPSDFDEPFEFEGVLVTFGMTFKRL